MNLKILNKEVQYEELPFNAFSGLTYGQCNSINSTIFVAEHLKPDHKQETILHEVIHMISDYLAIGLDERQVTALSSGLYCVLKENGIEVKFNDKKEEVHE